MVINSILEYNNTILQTKVLDEAYYNDKPLVSDEKYDELYFAIKDFEERTGTVSEDSPTQKVKYTVLSSLSKTTHSHWMGSADKTKEIGDIQRFCNAYDTIAMWKLDGLSVCLTYENGLLVKAETRGDGNVGEDVTHNAWVVSNIPRRINVTDNFTVDGEIICTYKDFQRFATEYKNPRNFASGSIRLLDNQKSRERLLKFYAWETDYNIPTLHEKLNWLETLGFNVSDWVMVNNDSIDDSVQSLKDWATKADIPIDGLVYKYDNVEQFLEQGKTTHHYKGMLALKFYDEEYESSLTNIVWQIGRQGSLTPVAEFEPIDIDGTTVSRASLHNVSVMTDKLGIPFVGQKVWITKRNEIIPQIERSERSALEGDVKFNVPSKCPICGGLTLITISDSGVQELICQNPYCTGKNMKRIEHFCSKKGLDIKGISEKTIEFLHDKGWLKEITDLFKLREHYADWIVEKGWGKASVDKIIMSIDKVKECELHKFISALGIPLIGEVEAKSIAKNVNDDYIDMRVLFDRNYEYAYSVINSWAGFGPAKADAILKFDWRDADDIAKYLTFKKVAEAPASANLEGEVICITGSLKTCKNRDDLKIIIEANGGKVASSVSSKITLLVNNDINSTSAKNKKAKELGIPIITEQELLSRTS